MKYSIKKALSAVALTFAFSTAANTANAVPAVNYTAFNSIFNEATAPLLLLPFNAAAVVERGSAAIEEAFAMLRDRVATGSNTVDATAERLPVAYIPTPIAKPALPTERKAAPRRSEAVFNTVAFSLKRLKAADSFAPSLAEIRSGKMLDCQSASCGGARKTIAAAIDETRGASVRDKLVRINNAVNNAVTYTRDIDLYKVADRWAKPSETLDRKRGDCEDFAILKMAALNKAGIPMQDMSLVVLYDQRRSVYHAVLSVAVGGNYFILDNVRNSVLLDKRLPDYMPLFSLADGRAFFHGTRVKDTKQVAKLLPFEKVAPGEGPEGL